MLKTFYYPFQLLIVACSSGDNAIKSVAYLPDAMADADVSKSQEPNKAPFNMAYKTDLALHEWIQQPENLLLSKRLQQGMRAIAGHAAENFLSSGK